MPSDCLHTHTHTHGRAYMTQKTSTIDILTHSHIPSLYTCNQDVVANPHLRDSDDEADDSLTSAGKKINDLLKGDDAEKGSSSSSGGSKKDKKRTSGGKRSSKDKSKSPTPIDNGDSMDDDSDDYDSDDNYDDLDFSDDDDGDSEEDTNSSNIINNNNNIHTSSSSSSGTPPSGMAPGQKQGSVGVSSSGSGSRKKRSRDGTGPAAPGKKKAKTSLPPTVTEGEIRAEFAKHNNTMTSKQLVENLKRNRDHLDSQNLLGVLRSICSMEVDKTGQRILILKK